MSKKALCLVLVLSAATLAACGGGEPPAPTTEAPPAATAAAAPAAGSGVIAGTVTYSNGDPDAAIKMDADPICQGLHTEPAFSEKVVASTDGQLANVFVYVKTGLSGKYSAPSEAQLLNQEGCKYTPHVSGIMVGQKLIIRNSDPTLHNVHALPQKNQEFNQGQPFQGMELEKSFSTPEVMVRFKCDVHPWMSSYMGVMEHPFYAVSGTDGSFSIDGLPAGDYEIEAWHEELGTRTLSVSVAADGTAEANFDFSPTA